MVRWRFSAAVAAVARLMIIPIYCRAGSVPAEKRHRMYCNSHGDKTLQSEGPLHGRLRAAGNDLINAVSQPR